MKLARDDEKTARLRLDAADRGNRPSLSAQVTGGVEDGVVPNLYDNRGYVIAGSGPRRADLHRQAGHGRPHGGGRRRPVRPGPRARAERHDHDGCAERLFRPQRGQGPAGKRGHRSSRRPRRRWHLRQTRYANGVITNFELLDAQSSSRSAELSRLQARYDCVLARQAVARAAGVAPQQ